LHYFICDIVSGNACNKEPDKHKKLVFMTGEEIIEMVGDRLFPPVKEFLQSATPPKVGIQVPKLSL
jgi:hypothetical protein